MADFGKEAQLTYIVNESCIRCKYMDCVEVCPVDCFYECESPELAAALTKEGKAGSA